MVFSERSSRPTSVWFMGCLLYTSSIYIAGERACADVTATSLTLFHISTVQQINMYKSFTLEKPIDKNELFKNTISRCVAGVIRSGHEIDMIWFGVEGGHMMCNRPQGHRVGVGIVRTA